MAADDRPGPSLVVAPDQPLIGVVEVESGRAVVRYATDDDAASSVSSAAVIAEARALAGAWADFDWEEAVAELDRIRHQSVPTPSIDAL